MHKNKNTPIVGIDFGTSNSAVSYYTAQGPKLIELLPGEFTAPSAIFADAESGAFLFGKPAIDAYISGTEGRLLRSLKSILGSSLYEPIFLCCGTATAPTS